MNESQFVTILFVLIPEKQEVYYLFVRLWGACWFMLAPAVKWEILEDNELLHTCLLIGIC